MSQKWDHVLILQGIADLITLSKEDDLNGLIWLEQKL